MSHDYIALEWVKGEIEETLQQAQQALEAYVENPQDQTRLKFCLSYLHQVHGTLQMVEFYGAALLAEEMEALAKALSSGEVKNQQDVLEVLMQAILHLPNYLEHVKVGRRDLPVVLTPILNELRAARGESLMSESAVFSPNIPVLSPLNKDQLKKFAAPAFLPWLKKIRQMLQAAILHILQGKQEKVALEYLTKVFSKLHKSLGKTPSGIVWAPALAFTDYLKTEKEIPKSAKPLLRQLDVQLKQIQDQGIAVINQPANEELIKNLLFYIAKSPLESGPTAFVKDKFELNKALPEAAGATGLTGPDKETVGTVVAALIEEITALKDQFDLLVRNTDDRQQALAELMPAFKQITDTMGMLGLGMPRRVLQEQMSSVARILDSGLVEDAALMDIAGALLYVEATLAGMQAEGSLTETRPEESSISDAQHAVLREARNVLEQVKDAIVEYIAKQWDAAELDEVPDLLKSIEGSINMIPLPRAAKILELAASFVEQQLIAEGLKAQWSIMDNFADILTSVEYYIERYSNSPTEADENLLIRAEQALAELPGMSPQQLEVTNETSGNDDLAAALEHIDVAGDVEEVVEVDLVSVLDAEDEASPQVEVIAELPVDEPDEETVAEQAEEIVELVTEESEPESPQLVEIEVAEPAKPEDAEAEQAQAEEQDDDDLIDDEIIEIFLEEAEEVLETLHEFWPQYKTDLADTEAQTTVRRAFHTLKGSGRMVQAEFIGELAWSIENMLNRVIDNTIELDVNGIALIDKVISHLPQLIDDFRNRRKPDIDVQSMMDYGEALAKGEAVAALDTEDASQDASATAPASESDENEDELLEQETELAPVAEIELAEVIEPQDVVELQDVVESEPAADQQDDSLLDDALIDIFRTETSTHLATVQEFIAESNETSCGNELTDQLQRALHTLKGSAHMAGISPIALVASPLEKLIKELRAYQVRNTPGLVGLLEEGVELIQAGIEQLETTPTQPLANEGEFLLKVGELEGLLLHPVSEPAADSNAPDPLQLAQFLSEGMDALMDADQLVKVWLKNPQDLDGLKRLNEELQQVSQGAVKADLEEVVQVCEALSVLYQRILDSDNTAQTEIADLALEAHETLLTMLDYLAAGQKIDSPQALVERLETIELVTAEQELVDAPDIETISEQDVVTAEAELMPAQPDAEQAPVVQEKEPLSADIDEELLEIFLEEAQEIMETASAALQRWQENPDNLLDVAELQRELHTLKGGARMAEISAVADLCHELESIYEGLHDGRVSFHPQLIPVLVECHDVLDDLLEQVRSGFNPVVPTALVTEIHRIAKGGEPDLQALSVTEPQTEEISVSGPVATPEAEEDTSSIVEYQAADQLVVESLDESDREILEIFLDEAQELQDELDGVIQAWQQEPEDISATNEIQRIMHTLKGGARLGGLTAVGDLSHDFEAWMIKAQQGQIDIDETFFAEVYRRQDELAGHIERVAASLKNEAAESVSVPELSIVENDSVEILPAEADSDTNVVPFKRESEAAEEVTELAPVPQQPRTPAAEVDDNRPQQGRKAPQEMVKVSAELLDNLVNLAGETSISRGRLEQQVTDFSQSLDEMDSTLDRLSDQLRRLDIETQAQVLFRQERHAGPEYEDFDPLEMDRYSHMQQLARSLVESASDLLDIRESLSNKTRDAETLLLQQSRVNTELQEGLMQTRMVPFQRLVPRLRRIVRQISQELGKQVEFKVFNADGEMDRTILERLISPLEHMLRNAVDHGIEDKNGRSAAGKAAQGTVELRVARDGGDVLVSLKDDGKGINIDAIRSKAIERGLMTADSKLPDSEVMQFILHAGFSTAEKVTQISGRGVGMDVVNSEIKQMGGSLTIDSVFGQGTDFQVRLPFTVSVNRALMVRVGDDLYAVPLDSIQGIVRVASNQLESLYEMPLADRSFEYSGTEHRLEYLGSMLGSEAKPKLAGQKMPIPVLLIQGETPYALQVDSLLGSREIVVKTLGTQFGSVLGVSGGTILGDGSVVIILDLPAMMRNQASLEYQQAKALDAIEAEKRHEQEERIKRILVVDDSVTVRKVTTRLLERNGFEVFTAKDGVDAIATLQDHIPDLMLLDIEMPRMDGFEVASIVRHDSRLQHVPIIMITSRTGSKHKNRALSIGVNEYMGKPFQEDTLLSTIDKLLAPVEA